MKINLLSYFIILLFCFSCSTTIEPKNDVDALYQKFHGKYKIISSYSNVAVDANLDGKESIDLKNELTDFNNSQTEIRIYGGKNGKPNSFHFKQFWQEQFMSGGETKIGISPNIYIPSMIVNFAMQGATKSFEFSSDLKKLNIYPDTTFGNNEDAKERFKNPESVTIEENERLKIITNKWVFTRKGWVNVTITSVYERYTMIT
jgi:hypothetical protein